MTKKSDPDTKQLRLSPNQKSIQDLKSGRCTNELQTKIKELEDHIKQPNENKSTETEGLKKLLLQSLDCVSTDKDNITDIMAKEK